MRSTGAAGHVDSVFLVKLRRPVNAGVIRSQSQSSVLAPSRGSEVNTLLVKCLLEVLNAQGPSSTTFSTKEATDDRL